MRVSHVAGVELAGPSNVVSRVLFGHLVAQSCVRDLSGNTTPTAPDCAVRFPIGRVGLPLISVAAVTRSAPDLNVLFVTVDQWRGDCLGSAGHPVVRTPNLDRLAAGGVSFRRHFAQAAPCGPEPGVALHRHVPHEPPVGAQRHAARRPPHQRRARRPGAGLRARAVRLHRHQRRPPHGRARRPAAAHLRGRAARLRPGGLPPRGRSAGVARLDARRRGRRARRLARVRRPAGRGHALAHAVRRQAQPDRVPHRSPARLRRRPVGDGQAVVRARLVPPAPPALPRAGAVRHDVRPGVGARRRYAPRPAPKRARSTRCSR